MVAARCPRLLRPFSLGVLVLCLCSLGPGSTLAEYAPKRTTASQVNTGFFLSALRKHDTTGQDFGQTSTREFLDIMKHSTPFSEGVEFGSRENLDYYPYNFPDGVNVSFHEDGYPTELPTAKLSWSPLWKYSVYASIGEGNAYVEDGDYLVTWTGSGNLTFESDATLKEMNDTNSAIVTVAPSAGVVVRIVDTDPEDPIRNISMIHTNYVDLDPRPTFHPQFVEALTGASVLRFSLWQRIDQYGNEVSISRDWDSRPQTWHQTQAGELGVSIEHMIELANLIGANPWFSMPMPDSEEAGYIDPYSKNFAELVNSQLDSNLKVYVEYRSCCGAGGLAPGWNDENAIASLIIWGTWESVMDPERVVNTMSALPQIALYGSDVGEIEAAALDASFGDLCDYGDTICIEYGGADAWGAYGNYTAEELIEHVLWPAMLRREAQLNQKVQVALHYGLEPIAFNALPIISAGNYKHRGTLNYAVGCETCLAATRGRTLGYKERAEALSDGWVEELGTQNFYQYQGLAEEDRVYIGDDYYHWGTVAEAKAKCESASDCKGFTYVKSGDWACGLKGNRYGKCDNPGAAWFFNLDRTGSAAHSPPLKCSVYSDISPSWDCSEGTVDTYYKEDTRSESVQLAEEEAALAECTTCQVGWNSHYYTYTVPDEGFTLDRLHAVLPELAEKAAQEQTLEATMIEALRHRNMGDLMLHYMERLCLIGFKTVVSGTMHSVERRCRTGGKMCGISSMMSHPDDEGPVRVAFESYFEGVRGEPLEQPDTADTTDCALPCVYGVCEEGVCRCWERVSGADCSILETTPRCERPMGMNIANDAYWSRQGIWVDVMKPTGSWNAQEFTSYTWSTGTDVDYRSDGYPAWLGVNQVVSLLTARDVQRHHYPDGWYTVLYEGDGILSFGLDVLETWRVKPGHIEIYVNLTIGANNGIMMKVTRTNEDDPIRNVRIIMPGFEKTYAVSPFHPAFKASIKRYSMFRFMGWMSANNEGTPWDWSDRVTPEYYSQAVLGSSAEYMVLLSNEMAADPWFALPINATDEYFREFATLVGKSLRPDLQVYVELANEVWGTLFFGGQWATLRASAEDIPRLCWYIKRTAEMGVIMKEVFAKSGHNVTIIGSSQSANPDVTSQYLACDGADQLDAIAIAPYFDGWSTIPDEDSATIEDVMASYSTAIELSINKTLEHKAIINGAKKLFTYESGPGGEGDGTSTDLAMTAHRTDGMRQLLLRYLQEMDPLLDLQGYFSSCATPSKYGSWGLIEAIDQDRSEAPKYLGMQDFLDEKTTCEAEDECVADDGCNGKGICGTDDKCYCYRGYSGSSCLTSSYTDYVSCGYQCTFQQGLCEVAEIIGNLRSWNCSCHEDYSGATCSRFTCKDECNNRGHCISSDVCSCFRGYKGEWCEVDCNCGHHGYCADDYTCICDAGFRKTADGTSCEWDCDTYDTLGCVGPGQSACSDCQYGNCVDGFCRCWAGYYGASCSTLDTTLMANSGSPIGMNVNKHSFGSFVDVMKTSSKWTSIWAPDTYGGQFGYQGSTVTWTNDQFVWGNGQTISLDADRYPTKLEENQNLISLALRDVCHHAQDGRYVVLYDGDGEIDFSMDSSSAAFQKGRIDIDFAGTCKEECWFDKKTWKPYCSDNGIAVRVKKTNPENPIRNIRIITPGFFATHHIEPFHPWYLKNLERFSFLRFMGLMNTNSDSHVTRSVAVVTYVRFTVLSVRGGGSPRIAEFIMKDANDATLECTSDEWPELCDNSAYTDWAPTANFSVVLQVAAGSKLDSYMWVTSSWNRRVDPITWTLESSTDGETWEVLDDRSITQTVTIYRRSKAAKDTPEEDSYYLITFDSDYLEWDDRTTPETRQQGPVAIENLVLLSNTVGAAPWVCVHHRASDDYVRKEAAYWLEHLRPDVDVYVEHSNEVWNPLFVQGRFATAKGHSLGLVDNTCRTNQDHCARVRYNAYRSKQIFAIWKEVWGTSTSRLKLVISTQTAWTNVARDMLDVTDIGATHLGITGYMSPATTIDDKMASWTEEEVLEDLGSNVDYLRGKIQEHKAVATEQGLELAVYEGGVGLVEQGVIEGGEATGYVTELLIATGRNPAMTATLKKFFDMFQEEIGSTPFGYFASCGFWSKYGQWGMREFYDASTANSPAAKAVENWLDAVTQERPSCLVANSFGRGLPADSFAGPPAVWTPAPQAKLVAGESYTITWAAAERMASDKNLTFYLWQKTSCSGSSTKVGTAYMQSGTATFAVPETLSGEEFFVELRSEALDIPSNYSGLFTILSPEEAPVSYLLYVANDVDLLSAFHRNCKGDKDYALKTDFKINSCVYSSAEGCRTYRTSRKTVKADGPPPWVHGSFKPLTDCTLHVLGLRQTMALEGLTQTFDTASASSLVKIVANASQLPEGAVSITFNGRRLGDSLLEEEEGRHLTSTVEVTISINTDDGGIASVAKALAGVGKNTAFAKTAAAALGVESLTVTMSDDLSTEDIESSNPVETDDTGTNDTGSESTTTDPDSKTDGTGSGLTNASPIGAKLISSPLLLLLLTPGFVFLAC